MSAPFCTVEQASEEGARDAGAKRLGVPPEDVRVVPLSAGRYRVEVARAPFTIEIEIDAHGLEAVARIAPALGDAVQPTRADVLRALERKGVRFGILEGEIDRVLAMVVERKVEQRGVVVARGARPVRGEDARIERRLAPAPGDRFALVRDGDVLIVRRPPTPGAEGATVTGDRIPAASGEDPPIAVGAGLECDPERRAWRARVPGFGYLVQDGAGTPSVVPAIAISADRLSATADLRIPSGLGPGRADLDAAIAAAGIVHGLQTRRVAALGRALEQRRAPRRAVRIAYGTPPRAGRDAALELTPHPGRAVDARTARVDHRERGTARGAYRGERVATWRAASAGVDGVGVDGAPLPAPRGAALELALGEHVVAGEAEQDGGVPIVALADGAVVTPAPHQIDVAPVLEIAADVDYATGNLTVNGCLVVRGSVRSGFLVAARHDVTVGESIEDAVVEAGGSIAVARGILGGERGWVSAGRDVRAHHAQNARITSGGDVELQSAATNSEIECAGRLTVSEGPGRLAGGRYVAARGVRVRELGSVAAVSTVVIVGTSPAMARRLKAVHEEARRRRAQGRKLLRSVGAAASPGKADARSESAARARKLAKGLRELARTEAVLRERRGHLARSLFQAEPPEVSVSARVFPGVEVQILDAAVRVDVARAGARFRYDERNGRIYIQDL